MFTKYGYFTIGLASFIFIVFTIISLFISNNYIKVILIVLPLLFLIFSLNFFRDPEKVIPNKKGIIVTPADGKVLIIKDVEEPEFIKGSAVQVSIFMSPLNVHVNRIPISGTVDYLRYYNGKFIAAFEDKASEENERSVFGIHSEYGKMMYTQVAGAVARRIIYELHQGDTVKMGERFGMIKFGSRVDIIVPKDKWILKVKKDDVVSAGETIIFEYNSATK